MQKSSSSLSVDSAPAAGGPSGESAVNSAWREFAMCKGKTEIFFATPGERDGRRRRREALARAYCAVCPVVESCREAGRMGREHGLWGSESDEQRAAAGFGARSPHRRSVAAAARKAREEGRGPQQTRTVEVA